MAVVETIDITTLIGSDTFPVNANEFYDLVETIAVQNIRAVKSSNRIEDAFYDYVVDNGKVIEEAIVKMAESQEFVNKGNPSFAPKDAVLAVKYFNNWTTKQYQTTTRRDEVKKIIADKGTGADELIAQILGSLTEGEGFDDYKAMRDIIQNEAVGVDASTQLFNGKEPKNMKGIIYVMREMYNALKATNTKGLDENGFDQATPIEDIRIAISESILNLMDIVELANIFNLSKEELFGKLVVIPYDADYDTAHVLVYDRKALGRGTRLFEYSQDIVGKGLYTNHFLTTERCYFYNSLYKALYIDVTTAYEASIDGLLQDKTEETQEAQAENNG